MINSFLAALLPNEYVTIIDIGASISKKGNYLETVSQHPKVRTIGFEANEALCVERQQHAPEKDKFYPYFIGDGQKRTFYEYYNPENSSLFKPNTELIHKFQDLGRIKTINEYEVETTRLDDVGIDDADFIKLDIQGAELMALQNGRELYKKATLLDVEVEFLPIYQDQPLYGDIEKELGNNDFHLMKFNEIFSRQLAPCFLQNDYQHGGGIYLWANSAFFMRDLTSLATLPDNKLLKMAFLIDAIWNHMDVPMHILSIIDSRNGTNFLQGYMRSINRLYSKKNSER